MSEQSVMDLLAQHPFTFELSAEQRRALAGLARVEMYLPDTLLVREGQAATAFLLIMDGRVAVELFLPEGGVRRLQTVEKGSAVGWSWMLPPYRWEFDVRALSHTTAIVLDGQRLRDLFARDCCLGLHLVTRLLSVVSERLKATRLQLLDIYAPPREVRR